MESVYHFPKFNCLKKWWWAMGVHSKEVAYILKLKAYNIKVQGWSTMFGDQSGLLGWTFVRAHLQG